MKYCIKECKYPKAPKITTDENGNLIVEHEIMSIYIAAAYGGIYTSKDLEDWTQTPLTAAYDVIIVNDKAYVATTDGIFTTENGLDFRKMDDFPASGYRALDYQNETLFAMGINNKYISTLGTDGIVNNNEKPDGSGITYSVKYINGEYIAIDNNGAILTSTDGSIWDFKKITINGGVEITLFPTNTLDMACDIDKEIYVVVSRTGVVYYSNDTKEWNTATSDVVNGNDLYSVCYSSEYKCFYAVGNNGIVIISDDGKIWKKIDVQTNENLRGVEEYQNGIIISGYNGILITTTDGITFVHHEVTNNPNVYNTQMLEK